MTVWTRIMIVAIAVAMATVWGLLSARAGSTTTQDWHGSSQFMDPSKRISRLTGTDMQEKRNQGFYGPGRSVSCYNSAMGSGTDTSTSGSGDGDVSPDIGSENTGDVTATQYCQ